MTDYNTKYWRIEISREENVKKFKGAVVRVLVQKKESLDSIMVTLPARSTTLTKKVVALFHKWLLISERPVSNLNCGEQLYLFEGILREIDGKSKCLA